MSRPCPDHALALAKAKASGTRAAGLVLIMERLIRPEGGPSLAQWTALLEAVQEYVKDRTVYERLEESGCPGWR